MVAVDYSQKYSNKPLLVNRPTTVAFWTVVRATVIKDFTNFSRYKQNFVGQFIRSLIFILIFYFFSTTMILEDIRNKDPNTVFVFYLAAMMLMMYNDVALWSPFQQVRNDQYNGTLEAIYQNNASRYGYYIGGVLSRAIFNTIFFFPFFLVLVFIARPSVINTLFMLSAVAMTLMTLMVFGVIIGLLAILFKEIGSVVNILGLLFQFVTGAIIPFASLPVFLQWFGYIFPVTYGFDMIRYYAFNGVWDPIMPIAYQWAIQFGIFVLFVGISRFLLAKVEAYSKREGLHLI